MNPYIIDIATAIVVITIAIPAIIVSIKELKEQKHGQ